MNEIDPPQSSYIALEAALTRFFAQDPTEPALIWAVELTHAVYKDQTRSIRGETSVGTSQELSPSGLHRTNCQENRCSLQEQIQRLPTEDLDIEQQLKAEYSDVEQESNLLDSTLALSSLKPDPQTITVQSIDANIRQEVLAWFNNPDSFLEAVHGNRQSRSFANLFGIFQVQSKNNMKVTILKRLTSLAILDATAGAGYRKRRAWKQGGKVALELRLNQEYDTFLYETVTDSIELGARLQEVAEALGGRGSIFLLPSFAGSRRRFKTKTVVKKCKGLFSGDLGDLNKIASQLIGYLHVDIPKWRPTTCQGGQIVDCDETPE